MLKFECVNCGNKKCLIKIDDENDLVIECLACENIELVSGNSDITVDLDIK